MSLARRAPSWVLHAGALAWAYAACSAGTVAPKDAGTAGPPDGAEPAPAGHDASTILPADDASTSGASDAASAPEPAVCLPRAARTYVGLSAGMTLEDFELAAYEAERAIAAVRRELCDPARAAALDPSGALDAEVQARALELYELVFTRDDAGAADVGLRRLATDAGIGAAYRVAAERVTTRWEVLEVSPQ